MPVGDLKDAAVIVVDMWERHRCARTTSRMKELSIRLNRQLPRLRRLGCTVIFAPFGTMETYKGCRQRNAMRLHSGREPRDLRPDEIIEIPDLGASPCECKNEKHCGAHQLAGVRQSPLISIMNDDLISEAAIEIAGYCRVSEIDRLLYAGIAVNQCILLRKFGLLQMRKMGFHCAVIDDLSLTVLQRPDLSFDEEHELVLDSIRIQGVHITSIKELIGE
jgi:hypothetical protein